MKRLVLTSAAVLLSLATAAQADTIYRPRYPITDIASRPSPQHCVPSHEIDAMRARQMHRIEEGRSSGQLSWREFHALKAEQARIAADERYARADGCVTPTEYRRQEQELEASSRHIHQLKHNDEVAGWRRWYARRWY